MRKMKIFRLSALFLAALLCCSITPGQTALAAGIYEDVPSGFWAESYIKTLTDMGISNGVGNNRFGVGQPITRAEFIKMLIGVTGTPVTETKEEHFTDVKSGAWFHVYIESALAAGIVSYGSGAFDPDRPITREEMAIFAVNALGYGQLASRLKVEPPFPDVAENAGYIAVVKDFGIMNGLTLTEFGAKSTASREQAAAILVRMIKPELPERYHAFYAISSYSQIDYMDYFDEVSFGWSRLEYGSTGVTLNMTNSGGNSYSQPLGSEIPLARAGGKPRMLMVALNTSDNVMSAGVSQPLAEFIVKNKSDEAVDAIIEAITKQYGGIYFDGVTIDIENLRAGSKQSFTQFIELLSKRLSTLNKRLYVAVQPSGYYDGFDFKALGEAADKLILMAHDYAPKSLSEADRQIAYTTIPCAPIDKVYLALSEALDSMTGTTPDKIMLQFSLASAQTRIVDGVADAEIYTPGYDLIFRRMAMSGTELYYSETLESPYMKFTDSEGGQNVLWYEDVRSFSAKVKLAKMFGVTDFSVWRLGLIPQTAAQGYEDLDFKSFFK